MTGGNFLVGRVARATTGPPAAARNAYLTEVQATTENARVFERGVRFANFFHRGASGDAWQLSGLPNRARHTLFD